MKKMLPFPPNSHSHFFSSLKQLEKRLKLETNPSPPSTLSPPPPPPPPPPHDQSSNTQTDSLDSPIYLRFDQSSATTTGSTLQESDVPQEFLSDSCHFSLTQKNSTQDRGKEIEETSKSHDLDEIELLMKLLGLSDSNGQEEEEKRVGFEMGCDEEFYGKIVGVKGPKSVKEVERLEGWIKHFLNNGGKKEPVRLAHLLLGKAAFLNCLEASVAESGGFEFPSTIDGFLLSDPPLN